MEAVNGTHPDVRVHVEAASLPNSAPETPWYEGAELEDFTVSIPMMPEVVSAASCTFVRAGSWSLSQQVGNARWDLREGKEIWIKKGERIAYAGIGSFSVLAPVSGKIHHVGRDVKAYEWPNDADWSIGANDDDHTLIKIQPVKYSPRGSLVYEAYRDILEYHDKTYGRSLNFWLSSSNRSFLCYQFSNKDAFFEYETPHSP